MIEISGDDDEEVAEASDTDANVEGGETATENAESK